MRTIFTASTMKLIQAASLAMLCACARAPVSAAAGADPFAHVDWLAVFSALPGVTLTRGGTSGDGSTIVRIGRFASPISMDHMTEGDVNGTPMADIPLGATIDGADGNLVFAMIDRRVVLEATFLRDDPRFAHALVSFTNDRLMLHALHAAACYPMCSEGTKLGTVDTTAFTFDAGRLHSDGTVTSSIEEFAKSRPSFFAQGVYRRWTYGGKHLPLNPEVYDRPVYRAFRIRSVKPEITGYGLTGVDGCGQEHAVHVDFMASEFRKPGRELIFVSAGDQDGQVPNEAMVYEYVPFTPAVKSQCDGGW